MSKERACAGIIRQIVGEAAYETYLCKVTAVAEDFATCDVERILDEKEIKEVRLNATILLEDGLVIVPETDSYVLITNIDDDKYFVSQFSKIEKITLNVSDAVEVNVTNTMGINVADTMVVNVAENTMEMNVSDTLKMDVSDKMEINVSGTMKMDVSDKMEINSDTIEINGGGNDGLVKVKELTKKLNNVEQKVNDLITKLKSVSVALAPSGAYPFAPIFASVTNLVKTQQSEIENDKVTH